MVNGIEGGNISLKNTGGHNMKGCVLNNKVNKQRKPKWVVMAEKLNPPEYIEWLHKTMAYKHPKRKNYSKKFNL